MVRGQIILGCDEQLDVKAINGHVKLNAYLSTMPLEAKRQTVQGMVAGVMGPHTFGVSYTGNIPWGGMEKYIKDVHAYAGENKRSGSLAIEVFTCGEYFCICLMQPGKNPAIVNQLIKAFKDNEIECEITGEERFKLPDMILPD